jgi:hypothetical protein
MEKHAAITPDATPPEHEKAQPAEKTAAEQIAVLDADFRKRAAESVTRAAVKK